MMQLNEILNYHHSNVYVRAEKIRNSIKALLEIKARQLQGGLMQIPYTDIAIHLHDLELAHKNVWQLIRKHEQQCFRFES